MVAARLPDKRGDRARLRGGPHRDAARLGGPIQVRDRPGASLSLNASATVAASESGTLVSGASPSRWVAGGSSERDGGSERGPGPDCEKPQLPGRRGHWQAGRITLGRHSTRAASASAPPVLPTFHMPVGASASDSEPRQPENLKKNAGSLQKPHFS